LSQPAQSTTHGNSADDPAQLLQALRQENEQLREELRTRIVIEQAKGAVSSRFGILPEEAFELIRGLARSQRRPLHEFAAEVVARGGVLDGVAGAGGRPLTRSRPEPAKSVRSRAAHPSGDRVQQPVTTRPTAWD
jgi:ANTAR domain